MKEIYFAGSIRGGRDDATIYKRIIDLIILEGASVLTEHIGSKDLQATGEARSSREIHDRDLSWVRKADAIVAEVTNPSLGVGYELGKAEEWGKPILALYRPTPDKKLSAMIGGSLGIRVVDYQDVNELQPIIHEFLSS